MTPSPRVVVDTNVLISAALTPHGTPRRAVDWIVARGQLLLSAETFEELVTRFVPRERFERYLGREDRVAFVAEVGAVAEAVVTSSRLSVRSDPDDDRFVELAVDGRAACSVTGNAADFPGEHAGIPVLTPAEFVRRYVEV